MGKSKKKVVATITGFEQAVNSTNQIKNCFQPGLRALGKHSNMVVLLGAADGSVEIDECVKKHYANDNRWDYTFGYKGKAYFVEVHSANSSEVSVVVAKLQWLRQWLVAQAPNLNAIKATNAFHWIQSANFKIPIYSRHYRLAEQHGIMPKKSLNLK